MLQVDVWSDYVCPFCWLEVPVMDGLKEAMGDRVTIDWRAFELRPDPTPTLDPAGDYLKDTWARAVHPMAAERGMTLKLPPVQPRSRLALEAAEHARAEGKFDAMHRAIFQAFFEQGRDIGDLETLIELGADVGLQVDALTTALRFGTHTEAVLADERLAEALGVTGVPLIVLRPAGGSWDDAIALSGAQPLERVLAAARRVIAMAEGQAEGQAAELGTGEELGQEAGQKAGQGAGQGTEQGTGGTPKRTPGPASDEPAGPSCAA